MLIGDGPRALVVKIIEGPKGSAGLPREAALYVGHALPGDDKILRAPRFFGATDLGNGLVGIWLELVVSSQPGVWSAETFALVAEHLGHFTRSRPGSVDTAARLVAARDLCSRPDLAEQSLEMLDQHSTDALADQAYPPAIRRGLHRLWDRRAPVMAAVASAARAICHGDAQRNNLLPQSPQATTAVDWANLAIGPIGLDAATLLHYAIAYFHYDVRRAHDLDRAIFDGYLRGLGVVDGATTAEIRLTYTTQLAFGLGLLEIAPVLRLINDRGSRESAENFYRRPLPDVLNRRQDLATFLLELGNEAQKHSLCHARNSDRGLPGKNRRRGSISAAVPAAQRTRPFIPPAPSLRHRLGSGTTSARTVDRSAGLPRDSPGTSVN